MGSVMLRQVGMRKPNPDEALRLFSIPSLSHIAWTVLDKGNNTKRPAAAALLILFFLSGAAGLGYQIAWAKGFAAGIGHEFPAVLAVVTAFMSGMALGSACLGRRALDPSCYGWLEVVIGAWGLASARLVPLANRQMIHILGIDPAPWFHWTVVFSIVFLAVLPATAAMGATLPAIERFLFALSKPNATGLLYGMNVAGAACGSIATAFWLMPALGIARTVLAFGATNLVCGLAALWLVRNGSRHHAVPEFDRQGAVEGPLAVRLVCTGLLGIGLEVVLVRGLSHVLENTVYTFSVVVAVHLAGNALGAAVYHRFQTRAFFTIQNLLAALALACSASAIALNRIAPAYHALRMALGDSVGAVAWAETATAAVVFLPPAIAMGATFSALTQSSLRQRPSLGWSVALNLAGSAAAPAVFALLLIPSLGLRGALAAAALGYAALIGGKKAALTGLVTAACIPAMASTRNLIETRGERILALHEGVMASVAVLETTNGLAAGQAGLPRQAGARTLKVNNRFQMGGTAGRIAEQRQADIPLLLHPNPRRALFIGLGTGITFATAAHYPDLTAEGVELVPEVARVMPLFQEGPDAFPAANLQVYVADGRRFIQSTPRQYDVIVSDLFHPAQDGAGFLYGLEHFQAVRNRLANGGLFCQWLPLHQMDLETVRVIMKTFRRVFGSAEVWLLRFNVDTPVIGLIARTGERSVLENLVERKSLGHEALRAHLRSVGLADSTRLFGCYLGEAFESENDPVNTDDKPLVIFRAPELVFRAADDPGRRLLEFIAMFGEPNPAEGFPGASGEWVRRVEAFMRARNVYLRGLVAEARGDLSSAVAAYLESARLSGDFTAGYAQALAIATALSKSRPEFARAVLRGLAEARPERPVASELIDRLPAGQTDLPR